MCKRQGGGELQVEGNSSAGQFWDFKNKRKDFPGQWLIWPDVPF